MTGCDNLSFFVSGGGGGELFIVLLSCICRNGRGRPGRFTASVRADLRDGFGQQAQARAVDPGHVGAAGPDHVHAVLLA